MWSALVSLGFQPINKTLYQKRIMYKMKWIWQIGLEFLLDFSWCLDTQQKLTFLADIWCIKQIQRGDWAANNISWSFLCSAALLYAPLLLLLPVAIYPHHHDPWAVWCAYKFGGQCTVRNVSLVVSHTLHKTNTRKYVSQMISHLSSGSGCFNWPGPKWTMKMIHIKSNLF